MFNSRKLWVAYSGEVFRVVRKRFAFLLCKFNGPLLDLEFFRLKSVTIVVHKIYI